MAKTSGGGGRKAASTGAAGATPAQAAPAPGYKPLAGEVAVKGVTANPANWLKRTYFGVGSLAPTGAATKEGKGRWQVRDAKGRSLAHGDSRKALKEWGKKNLGIDVWE